MKKLLFSRQSLAFLLTVTLLSLVTSNIYAQTNKDLDFVYGTNHYNGATYSSSLIPKSVDTIYLIAEHTNIIAARFTQVYYWNITNEYKADWDSTNITIEGALEIIKGKKVFQIVDLTKYVIQYDGNNKIDTSIIYLGEKADTARNNYETLQKEYRDDLHSYYKILNDYTVRFQEALANLQRGTITEDQLPEAPNTLADFTLFSTELLYGFPINLPKGEYEIQLRLPDDSIQEGSRKRLIVFSSMDDGIGYSISGEERWNLPLDSLSENEVIYALKDSVYYIQPVEQKLYNERYYTRMNNPQNKTSRVDRNIWVPFRSAENVMLALSSGEHEEHLELQSYFVRQIMGTKLGYNIVPFDAENMTQPSFTAFKITLDDSSVFDLHLIAFDNKNIPGSAREIRVIKNNNQTWLLYLISASPFTFGLLAVLFRRKQVRDIKIVGFM